MEKAEHIIYPQKASIREEWHWVKPGIEEILHLDKHLNYLPEDVYASVINGDSELWVHPDFFTVLTIETDDYNGDRTLLIWLMWAKERGKGNAIQYTEFYENLGRYYGCKRVAGKGVQMPAIQYAIDKVGWEISEITFSKDLYEETE